MVAECIFPRLEAARFPSKIASLEHVLELVDEMLMSYEEALIKAAGTNQMQWLEQLLLLCNGSLTDAVASASSQGHVETVARLIRELNERENDSNRDSDGEISQNQMSTRTRRVLQKAVETAAAHGQINIVSMFLLQIVGSGEGQNDLYRTTWQVLDGAAANGHLNVVKFAVKFASKWVYFESYVASSEDDALALAIAGGYDAVATYLLENCRIKWDMENAYEKAIEAERLELAEWIYALCSQSAESRT